LNTKPEIVTSDLDIKARSAELQVQEERLRILIQ
jgi:hypothetical protein